MKSAIRISIYYAVLSILWIVVSDKLTVGLFPNIYDIETVSIIKGILFVLVTGSLLYIMINNEIKRKNNIIQKLDDEVKIREQLIRELHHRIKNNIQVVIGLMNIELNENIIVRESLNKITNKLISMMSVFNIVYDKREMDRVSLKAVLEEYQRISTRNIEIGIVDEKIEYSIETIVNCILMIDTYIEANLGNNNSIKTVIEAPIIGNLKFTIDPSYKEIELIENKDRQFLEMLVKSLNGKISYQTENYTANIIFTCVE